MHRHLRLGLFLVSAALPLGTATSLQAADASVRTAQDYGAVGDGKTDDWWSIQRGLDDLSAHGGGTLSLPPTPSNTYVIRQALRMRSNVILDVPRPDTVVRCTSNYSNAGNTKDPTGADIVYVNRWPLYGCTVFGSLNNAPNIDNLRRVRVDPRLGQAKWLSLADKADVAALAVGDLVVAAAAETFKIGDEEFPHWGEMDRVEEVDPAQGRVRLRYASTAASPIAVLEVLNPTSRFWERGGEDSSSTTSIGVPLWASWRSGLVGGTWIAQDEKGRDLPFSSGGGALDCSLRPHRVSAGWGVGYGNLWTHCEIAVEHEEITVTPFELAYLSSHNQVSIGDIVVKDARRVSDWIVNVDEAAHDNTVNIKSLTIEGDGIKDVVSIVTAQDNRVSIGAITGHPIGGSVVAFFNFKFAGAYPATEGNTVAIGHSDVRVKGPYVRFANADVRNNKVIDSEFSGSVTGASSVVGLSSEGENVTQNIKIH